MAETLSMISKISFVAAGICLVVAIILFIRFKIPDVIGDLSGRNARKSIEQMRALNEKSGSKSYKPSKKNIERGKLTETMHGLDETEKILKKQDNERPETGLLEENKITFSKITLKIKFLFEKFYLYWNITMTFLSTEWN